MRISDLLVAKIREYGFSQLPKDQEHLRQHAKAMQELLLELLGPAEARSEADGGDFGRELRATLEARILSKLAQESDTVPQFASIETLSVVQTKIGMWVDIRMRLKGDP